jgi:hypothetical protein
MPRFEQQLGLASKKDAFDRLYMPRQAPHGVPNNDLPALYDFTAQKLGDGPIRYLEFGVAGGRSMSRMVERFSNPDARFFGFDSFQGLPEDWVLPWNTTPRGAFSTGGDLPDIADPRVSFVKGWFQNTLPPFLAAHPLGGGGPVLVHYDADLYSATLFVLATLWQACSEHFFIFDEFMSHEIIALDDFARAFPVKIEFYCQTNAGGYPNQVFGRIRRVPMVVA